MTKTLTANQKAYLARALATGNFTGCARMRARLHALGFLRHGKPTQWGNLPTELTSLGRLAGNIYRGH